MYYQYSNVMADASMVLESLFYAWRATGEQIWRDYAWEAYLHMKESAGTDTAWAGIVNVNDKSSPLVDSTESLLYSEVFKYLYLIFSDSSSYSLDEYVLTARGHILKRNSASPGSARATTKRGKEKIITSFAAAQGRL